jgi:hypothetical protein
MLCRTGTTIRVFAAPGKGYPHAVDMGGTQHNDRWDGTGTTTEVHLCGKISPGDWKSCRNPNGHAAPHRTWGWC